MLFKFHLLQGSTLASGKIANFMERENFTSRMDHTTKEHSSMEVLLVKGDISSIMAAYMREKSKITNPMVLETIVIPFRVIIMRDSGTEILHREKEKKNFLMAPIMMANFYMELKMDMDDMSLIPASMKDSSRMVILMVKAPLPMLINVPLQVIGLMVSLKVEGYLLGQMVTDMKGNTLMV